MNTPSKWIVGLALTVASGFATTPALAWHHGPRVTFGVNFGPYWGPYWGGPYWGPGWGPAWYYPPPYYYPPAVVVAPPAPQQYVERSDQPAQSSYWYYCEASRGYYPYVRDCPGGWRAVPPAPAPAQ